MKGRSMPLECCEGSKKIRRFYFGTVQEYELNEENIYVPTGNEKPVYLCHPIDNKCAECEGFKFFGLCQFTDSDNLKCY